MGKLFYATSALLMVVAAGAGLFNVGVILNSNLTVAGAENVVIFPINLFLQSLTFLGLGLILAKLRGIERRGEERPPYRENASAGSHAEIRARRDCVPLDAAKGSLA